MSFAFQPFSDRAKFLTALPNRIAVVFSGMACVSMSYLCRGG